MPEIKGFRGWRYDKRTIKDLSSVFAPPYDVISKKEQEALHKKNPYNVVRLILGKEKSGDSGLNNKYSRAGKFLDEWSKSGVLAQEESPAIYVYAQEYSEEGKIRSRVGFMAAMKIDERSVLRHENTLARPKIDRMALLKEVRTNLSPVFGLFEDKSGNVQKLLKEAMTLSPAIDVRIDGVWHRIFVEKRPEQLQKIRKEMLKKLMFIADGHHRFEVACQFKNWMRSNFPKAEDPGWDYVMTYFSDCGHNPFKIFPTHRLLSVSKKVKEPLKVLAQRGRLERVSGLGAILKRLASTRSQTEDKKYSFGILTRKEGFFIFTLNSKYSKLVGKNPVEKLDVAVLHKMIVGPCFKIATIEKSKDIDFTRDPKEACEKVKNGEFDMALFLRPTSLDEMLLVSKKGLKMPQKSTYFYPKLLSGLVFHKFDEPYKEHREVLNHCICCEGCHDPTTSFRGDV